MVSNQSRAEGVKLIKRRGRQHKLREEGVEQIKSRGHQNKSRAEGANTNQEQRAPQQITNRGRHHKSKADGDKNVFLTFFQGTKNINKGQKKG